MLKSIIKFLRSLNPNIIVQAPSRINLINPLDAVEGDFWMPSIAINGQTNPLSTFVYIKEAESNSNVIFYKISNEQDNIEIKIDFQDILTKNKQKLKRNKKSKARLVYASIYRFSKTISYFWKNYKEKNIELGILTTIPRQSGLGGSASIIIAIIYAFALYFNIYNNFTLLKNKEIPINKDIIAEMATKVEDRDLNITAGYSDRYSISRGGLGFCSYYGKLHHKKISMEPIAIYDRIDKIYQITDLPIIICYSGVLHNSGGVHKKLRELYLKNDSYIIRSYKNLAEISWKSRFALMKHDWRKLGLLCKKNNEIMNKVMNYAGFEHGIGYANNILIKLIEDHPDVYAVKLTGAGGGGSVFALVDPNNIENILMEWKSRLYSLLKENDRFTNKDPKSDPFLFKSLRNAKFFKIKISREGVKKI